MIKQYVFWISVFVLLSLYGLLEDLTSATLLFIGLAILFLIGDSILNTKNKITEKLWSNYLEENIMSGGNKDSSSENISSESLEVNSDINKSADKISTISSSESLEINSSMNKKDDEISKDSDKIEQDKLECDGFLSKIEIHEKEMEPKIQSVTQSRNAGTQNHKRYASEPPKVEQSTRNIVKKQKINKFKFV